MKHERFINLEGCGLQVREASEQEEQSRVVVGMPIVFGVRSRNLTPWSSTREIYEVLEPGCITKELIERSDVVLNWCHKNDVIFARSVNGKGTLQLDVDDKCVRSEAEMPNTTAGNDVLELIRRGDITGMSFAFEDNDDDPESVTYEREAKQSADREDVWIRRVRKITGLFDVSIVTHPAYTQTSVAQREITDSMMEKIDSVSEKKTDDDAEQRQEEARKAARRKETETLLLL